eukprot:PhM_4_TR16126/c1_g4_i3/m.101249
MSWASDAELGEHPADGSSGDLPPESDTFGDRYPTRVRRAADRYSPSAPGCTHTSSGGLTGGGVSDRPRRTLRPPLELTASETGALCLRRLPDPSRARSPTPTSTSSSTLPATPSTSPSSSASSTSPSVSPTSSSTPTPTPTSSGSSRTPRSATRTPTPPPAIVRPDPKAATTRTPTDVQADPPATHTSPKPAAVRGTQTCDALHPYGPCPVPGCDRPGARHGAHTYGGWKNIAGLTAHLDLHLREATPDTIKHINALFSSLGANNAVCEACEKRCCAVTRAGRKLCPACKRLQPLSEHAAYVQRGPATNNRHVHFDLGDPTAAPQPLPPIDDLVATRTRMLRSVPLRARTAFANVLAAT